MVKLQELRVDYLINEHFGTRDRKRRVNYMQENFSDDVSEIDEPLSLKKPEQNFSNDENTCTEHPNNLDEDGFIHMIHEGCIC